MVMIWWFLAFFQVFLLVALARLLFHLFQVSVSDKVLPFVPSNNDIIKAVIASGELTGVKSFVDLGSGDGKVILKLARSYPKVNFVGVEYSYTLYLISCLRAWRNPRVRFVRADMFTVPVDQFEVIYGYWITGLIPKIYNKLSSEAKRGTKVICNTFSLPENCNFSKKTIINDHVKLMIYTI